MAETVLVEVTDPDADPAELDRLTRSLREEILLVDEVESVRAASAGEAPAGSRGLDVAAIGALVVGVAPTFTALATIVDVLRGWLRRPTASAGGTQTLKLTVNGETLELTPTAEQQQALVEAFLQRAGQQAAG